MTFVRTSAGPIVHILNGLEATKTEAAWAEMEQALSRYEAATGWGGPNEVLLTAARKSQLP
jgi:hypothetical protein